MCVLVCIAIDVCTRVKEHQRIWLEICRIVCAAGTAAFVAQHVRCVHDLLQSDYAPLQLEGCRGAVSAKLKGDDVAIEALFKLADNTGGEFCASFSCAACNRAHCGVCVGDTRLAAASALATLLNRNDDAALWARLVGSATRLKQDDKHSAGAADLLAKLT